MWAGMFAGIALVAALASASVTTAQETGKPVQQQRVRTLIRSAVELYKNGDYEKAAPLFVQAQASQSELTAIERNDLKNFAQKNSDALAGQRQGTLEIRLANEALHVGNTQEAARLVKNVTANQYLSATDRKTLASLNETLRLRSVPPGKDIEQGVENNEKALLAAAREALRQGKLDLAEAYNNQAKKVATFLHPFWADTPSKVDRDIAVARAKSKKDGPRSPDGSVVTRGPESAPPSARSEVANRIVQGPPLASGKQPEGPLGPLVTQTTYPNKNPSPSTGPANTSLARKLIKDGYKALENNDVDTARRLALEAKALRPDLEWWEENPSRLLEDIQRRAPAAKTPVVNATSKPAVAPEPHALIREARGLLQQEKIEEAEKLCAQATAAQPRGWGLFEDSPDKLRADIQKARGKRDREEAARLMVEARKLYALGNLQEAKQKAYTAQKLHGPYTIWELGDRPQKLLEEIQRAETKSTAPTTELAKTTDTNKSVVLPAPPPQPNRAEPPLVSGTAQAAVKIRAVGLLQQARELQKKGLLIEARAKAMEADQLKVTFGPDEDSPGSVLVSLAAQCERAVDQLLQRATDEVQNHPTDPNRFKKAEADISRARLFARSFRLDTTRIEQKAQWLQQAAASNTLQPIAAVSTPNDSSAIVQAVGAAPLPSAPPPPPAPLPVPPVESPAGRNRLLGQEKLDNARLELRAGNLAIARRLAEDAFHPQYGVQEEAAMVLRSIDADEHNHRVNIANRNADAGMEAYNRRDFRQAATIFQGIDMRLLQADKARRIGELMATPQMQPQNFQLVDAKAPAPAIYPANAGSATATDVDAGDDLTKNFRAMEEIQFQQFRDRGMNAQRTAMELFKAGRKAQALDVLKDYLDELGGTSFDAQRLALLKRPVERRMQQYRTILAQDALDKQVDSVTNRWNEGAREKAIRKTSEEVAEQMKLYRTFVKEGKYKEALAAARKAKELDPDNLAADAAIQIVTTQIAQEDYDKGKAQNEEMFLKSLNPSNGPYVDMTDPLKFDPDALKRAQARKNGENGFSSPIRDATERNIERKLSEPVSLTFKDTPLRQVISDLNQLVPGANITADLRALSEANISLDMPLTLPVEKISLKSALNILLDQVKLTYVIQDQVLMVTTKEKALGRNRRVTYSVADLVVPVGDHPNPGISDLNTALSRALQGATSMVNSGASPYTNSFALPNGTTVSSQGSGVGTNFATSGTGSGPTALVQRSQGNTIENLLIELIQKSIAPNSWSDVGGQGTIQYFPLGMALVVNQTQEVQEEVQALLQSLRRLQDLEVAIEMRLVSVSESFFERIGVDFNVNIKSPTSSANQIDLVNGQFTPFGQVNSQFQGIKAITGLTPAGTLTPDLAIPVKNSSFDFSVPPFGGFPGTLGADGGLSLGLAFLSDIQVFMFLEAAQGDRRMNIMQAPKITVFNGQTATISINDFQFFLTGLNINVAGGQLIPTPNNQPFPLGVNMTVTPVVSADRRFVRLNLTPSLTNLANANVPLIPVQIPVPQLLEGPGNGTTILGQPVIFQMFFQQPTFTSITVNTTVNVPDGGTVLLGGLKTMSEGRNEFGPPILSKIPYLSRLFKNVAYGRDGQSLMIMVTPRIIINEEEEQQFMGAIPPIPRP
jgi:type II secretory pathway component GspD/PulD (secretin)